MWRIGCWLSPVHLITVATLELDNFLNTGFVITEWGSQKKLLISSQQPSTLLTKLTTPAGKFYHL